MANPATIADIVARWRPLTTQETTNAAAFLGDAWEELLSKRPNLEADMTAETVRSGNVVRVVVAMALRILKNPDGWDQEAIDDWSGRRNQLVADGVLRVTPEELAAVTPGRRVRRSVRLVNYGDA
jgi:hypothetical protein